MDDLSRRLLARYQKGLPICAEPYRRMAETLGCRRSSGTARAARVLAPARWWRSTGPTRDNAPSASRRRSRSSTSASLQPLDLPMQEAYCIDLAFPLEASR